MVAKNLECSKPAGVREMNGNAGFVRVPMCMQDYRASGLLLHVTSLPSDYGIGDLASGFSWVDCLAGAGQQWWQALPTGPIGYGNSPYQPLSSFAGNVLLISPSSLIQDGLIRASDCAGNFSSQFVEFERVNAFKQRLLAVAWSNFNSGERKDLRPAYDEFCACNASWLEGYALFCALKARYKNASYVQWPTELVQRSPGAIAKATRELEAEVDRVRFSQFLLLRQANELREYAHRKGVGLIGDLPFFVSPDSSDVWEHPEFFLLDRRRRPCFVAGVPPDCFSSEGQLWGNPVYDWDVLRATGYRWYIDRVRALLAHVDVIRLDHFRGFVAAWHVRAGEQTARFGQWVRGPSAALFRAVEQELGCLPFIAEDLGIVTDDVKALRNQFRIPGTRVLQFAFDGHFENPYLPHNFASDTIVYTGTHDNATSRQWYEELPDWQRKNFWDYLKRAPGAIGEVPAELIRLAWSSNAAIAIAPLQDVLNLGREARMNVPGQAEGNWGWRWSRDKLSVERFEWLKELTVAANRVADAARHE